MESLFRYVTPPGDCGYLPGQTWRLEHEIVGDMTATEYRDRMLSGWRRFGHTIFRPRCHLCTACRSLRVVVERFRADRSQRRCRQLNDNVIQLRIGSPKVTPAKLDLYDRYHAFQSEAKGWPAHGVRDASGYVFSFVENPFPTQEWCYFLNDRLVGVAYVDDLPDGLSAIYFFYDPDLRARSLGTWNILCLLDQAAKRNVPYVYLGYYVAGCASMEYKARFVPNQIRQPDGQWQDFRF